MFLYFFRFINYKTKCFPCKPLTYKYMACWWFEFETTLPLKLNFDYLSSIIWITIILIINWSFDLSIRSTYVLSMTKIIKLWHLLEQGPQYKLLQNAFFVIEHFKYFSKILPSYTPKCIIIFKHYFTIIQKGPNTMNPYWMELEV